MHKSIRFLKKMLFFSEIFFNKKMYFISFLYDIFSSIFNLVLKIFSWSEKYSLLSDVLMQENGKLKLKVRTVIDLTEKKK